MLSHPRAALRASIIAILSLVAAAPLRADDAGRASGAAEDTKIPVRGVVKAVDKAELSTDLVARVTAIGFRFGERFKKGDLLVTFDCDRYRAEAQSADAVQREMQLTLDSNQHLEKFRAVGKHDLEISRARVAKAEAEARSLNSRLKQCEVRAPFDGRVSELTINAFEQPQANKPFLVIVGEGRLEVELIIPSHWLSWLKPGVPFSFGVDETKGSYDARVKRIGAAVDAVSQMIKVIAEFETPSGDILPGMSGVARFNEPNG